MTARRHIPLDPRTAAPLRAEDLLKFIHNTYNKCEEVREGAPTHLNPEIEANTQDGRNTAANPGDTKVVPRRDRPHPNPNLAVYEYRSNGWWERTTKVVGDLITDLSISVKFERGLPFKATDDSWGEDGVLVDLVCAVENGERMPIGQGAVMERLYRFDLVRPSIGHSFELAASSVIPPIKDGNDREVVTTAGLAPTSANEVGDENVKGGFEIVDEVAENSSETERGCFQFPKRQSEPTRLRVSVLLKTVRLPREPLVDGGS